MKKRAEIAAVRFSKVSQRKLQERSAVLYTRELERWNKRPLPVRSE